MRSCYLFSLFFPIRSEEDGHDDELKDAAEDKEYTDEHPDVKEGNVRHSRNILTNLSRNEYNLTYFPESIFTELNMVVTVSRVVIPMPTLAGIDSGGIKRDSQASTWRRRMMIQIMMMPETY